MHSDALPSWCPSCCYACNPLAVLFPARVSPGRHHLAPGTRAFGILFVVEWCVGQVCARPRRQVGLLVEQGYPGPTGSVWAAAPVLPHLALWWVVGGLSQLARVAQSQRIWATKKSKCGVGPFSFSRKPWFATKSLVRRFERRIHLCVCNPAQEPRTTSWQDPERRHPGRLGELEALSLNMNMTQSSGTLLGSICSLLK